VRWWATDFAVVNCAADPGAANVAYVAERLAVILRAYTVYLDLWLCDLDGNVLAGARSDRYKVEGANVAQTHWFADALKLRSGDDYVAGDIERQPLLGNAPVATYCASVREGGNAHGKPFCVLAIHFDWETQARAIVEGIRVDDDSPRLAAGFEVPRHRLVRRKRPAHRAHAANAERQPQRGLQGPFRTVPARRWRLTSPPATRPTRVSAGSV
jgi:hypothetical protein